MIHLSGATSIHALDAAPGPTACVHPLQTIWPELGPDQLEGAYAAVTGDAAAGERFARELGLMPFPLADEGKPLYHAASAFASNYLVTLTHVAARLMAEAGVDRELAFAALRPIQRRTVEVADRPPTGPIARGDAATVRAHLAALDPTWRRSTASWAGHAAVGLPRLRRRRPGTPVTVALVPTMGGLHDGHRALLRAARADADRS